MFYKTISPGDLQPGDQVRRLGKILTVSGIALASEHGAYEVIFEGGAKVRLAGRVAVVTVRPTQEFSARNW